MYAKVLFGFVAGVYLFEMAITLLSRQNFWAIHLSPSKLGHLATATVLAVVWGYLRRGQRSAVASYLVETAGTVGFCTATALGAFGISELKAGMIVIMAITFLIALSLVIRAAIVPSTPTQSVVVGLLSIPPLSIAGHHVYDGPGVGGLSTVFVGTVFPAVMVLLFVIATGITSRVIYGLHSRVRAAMQLGQYTLDDKIGEGGMGAVYRASHAMLRRPTAIKLLPPDKAGEKAITRFEREVQQTSRLAHPNTVAIYDFGRTPEGIFYYAMEFLDGLSFEELVAMDGPQPQGRVVHLLARIAEALAEAHGMGLIHRDIKPANVILCHRGGIPDVPKVVDFGLVKDLQAGGNVAVTQTDTITGTPLYMAPESLTAPDAVDPRTDLYALAAVGVFLLTGRTVFEGATLVEVCGHHLHSKPEAPSARLGSAVDEDLEALLFRCLEKKPQDRPANALEVRDRLLACEVAKEWSAVDAERWWQEHEDDIRSLHSTSRRASKATMTVALGERSGL